MLSDPLIRSALRSWISSRFEDERELVVHELPIAGGSAIVDMATVGQKLVGYEIKSDRDTLRRLSSQAMLYNQVFDRMVIVTTERHYDKVRAAVPAWWGIQVAVGLPTRFVKKRAVGNNPSQEAMPLLNLLTRRELGRLAKEVGLRGCSRFGSHEICLRITDSVDLPRLRDAVRSCLRSRLQSQTCDAESDVSVETRVPLQP